MQGVKPPEVDGLDDEALLALALDSDEPERGRLLGVLFARYHRKVAGWCLAVCGDRTEAADLAQEVFLRVHQRIDSFRGDSRFATWLYTVARRLAINHGIARARRPAESLEESPGEPVADLAEPADELHRAQLVARLQTAMREDLEPLEAKVLYLHYASGMSLPAITRLLELTNPSGAKAFIVNGKRKLRRVLAELVAGGV